MRFTRGISICLAVLLLLSLCGCNQEETTPQSSANFANTIMGGEVFASRDGFVYFADLGGIYEYDIKSGVTVKLTETDLDSLPSYLFATDEYVGYRCSVTIKNEQNEYESFHDLNYITRDGKQNGTFIRRETIQTPFLDGNTLFYCSSTLADDVPIGQLWRLDMASGEETLLLEADTINAYYVEETYIYAVVIYTNGTDKNGNQIQEYKLLRSAKDKIAFETVEMSLKPINLVADGTDLYIAQIGDWQLYHYANGVETALPVEAFFYQVFENHVVYFDKLPASGLGYTGFPLKSYDMKTGETKVINGSAFYFGVLDEQYLVYACTPDGVNFQWYILDWQTGETKEMVKPE